MKNAMRALVKSRPEEGLWMEHVPVPEPGPDEVLIKVRKSAICGTDVHIWNWDDWSAKTVPVGLTTGHEFVGEIADLGSAATKYRRGQRVSGEGPHRLRHLPQLSCRAWPPVPQYTRRRRPPQRRLRRIPLPAGIERRPRPR